MGLIFKRGKGIKMLFSDFLSEILHVNERILFEQPQATAISLNLPLTLFLILSYLSVHSCAKAGSQFQHFKEAKGLLNKTLILQYLKFILVLIKLLNKFPIWHFSLFFVNLI